MLKITRVIKYYQSENTRIRRPDRAEERLVMFCCRTPGILPVVSGQTRRGVGGMDAGDAAFRSEGT